MVSQELNIIKRFREMCGPKTLDGYALSVGTTNVPVFIGIDHEIQIPEIIIRPFITDNQVIEGDVFTSNDKRFKIKYNHTRFQTDIYANNIIELMNIKDVLYTRLDNFDKVELMAYSETTSWTPYNESEVYLNPHYTENVVKLEEVRELYTKVETLEETQGNPGTWYIDNTGLYVNPLNDIFDILIFVKQNGEVFSDGLTAYDVGISDMRLVGGRKTRDQEPEAERWSVDFIITYSMVEEINLGEKIDEAQINVQGE